MTDSPQPIAGWYPDPENAAAERWWDGTTWSDHRRASTVPVAPPIAPPGGAPSAAPALFPYGAPAAPPVSSPYGAPAYAPAAAPNSLAVLGFVLALGGLAVSFGGLTPLAGGIVSTFALVRASRMRRAGQPGARWGLALAGTICGYLFFVLIVALLAVTVPLLLNDPTFTSDLGVSST